MNIYGLLKLYRRIDSPRLKLLGLAVLHLLHRRYSCLFFDPVLACNLRCRMCYFSDPVARRDIHGRFSREDLDAIARALFPYMLKLQIGCGAEPTVCADLAHIVALGRKYGVPYISITTNGMLLTRQLVDDMVAGGLNEITLSAHGFSRDTYETLMQGASFARFLQLIDILREVRATEGGKGLKIRVNYTVNEDNIGDLPLFMNVFCGLHIDVLQIRPIQKIGDSDYNNFSREAIVSRYDECIQPVINACGELGTKCLYPLKEQLVTATTEGEAPDTLNSVVDMLPYFQLSPHDGWKDKINPYKEDFYGYCSRTHRLRYMLKNLVWYRGETRDDRTRAMDYSVK